MSDTLDWRRLYWSGTRGRAIVNGHGSELTTAPVIGGKPVAEIDYVPSLGVMWIRPAATEKQRDMESWEVVDAEAILAGTWAERSD